MACPGCEHTPGITAAAAAPGVAITVMLGVGLTAPPLFRIPDFVRGSPAPRSRATLRPYPLHHASPCGHSGRTPYFLDFVVSKLTIVLGSGGAGEAGGCVGVAFGLYGGWGWQPENAVETLGSTSHAFRPVSLSAPHPLLAL